MDLVPVPRVTHHDFRPSRRGGQPRVVVDCPPGRVAPQLWDPAYLRTVIGAHEVPVRETHGPPINIFQNLARGGSLPFGHYLDWVVETARAVGHLAEGHPTAREVTRAVRRLRLDHFYYLDVKLDRFPRALRDGAPVPDWYHAEPVDTNLWCGVLGTSCGLHCDVTPNCNTQIIGRKEFVLFPPSQSRYLYRLPGRTHCRFDPNAPDFQRFPLARRATGWHCTLRPGESLYIPVGWFHQVTVVSDWAVNVNFFWPRPFPQGLAIPGLWRFLLRRGRARLRTALRPAPHSGPR
ncbi:cupin-like domain-containing protein [Streptomyces sp. NPDC127068]|uniref:cupin-like domain-containing protein n=1 Tax=Streptomyces sp. NPDC127068 TaxID=3347127 RepID=UPI003656BBD5